jgi:uncharacterized protein (TIGR02118 family)
MSSTDFIEHAPPVPNARSAHTPIVRMGLLKRRASLSPAQFRKHWREVHGPIAARLPGLRKYHQNHVVDAEQRGIDYPRGPLTIDGLSELWFDDEDAMRRALESDAVDALAEDEVNFIDNLHVISAEQNIVIPPARGVPLLKRMSTLKRREDVSPEAFRHEWFDVHSVLVKRLPQVKGYVQNLIFDRSHGRGAAATRDELPIDGIVELWFDDVSSLQSAFRSPAGTTLMTHAREFIAEISTFLVEVHEVRILERSTDASASS